jgi:hypothetical protein
MRLCFDDPLLITLDPPGPPVPVAIESLGSISARKSMHIKVNNGTVVQNRVCPRFVHDKHTVDEVYGPCAPVHC